MNELSLFSGAGGGLLGTKLLGFNHIGYVEYDDYCQRIIKQRIIDGILDNAPIFGDIKTFISDGYADSYKGLVDIITAGFPCQPFSVAGNRKAEQDDRNMWPQTINVIRRIRPRYALLENVPGLLSHEYARRIFGDLAEIGFNARWRVLSASEVGAPHKRDRVFIFCTNSDELSNGQQHINEASRNDSKRGDVKLGDATSKFSDEFKNHGKTSTKKNHELRNTGRTDYVSNSEGERLEGWQLRLRKKKKYRTFSRASWWHSEPRVDRVANGVAHRVDRLKAIGNGQVPAVVKTVYELLTGEL